MGKGMEEKVARVLAARKMALEDGGIHLPNGLWRQCSLDSRAVLETCCYEELVFKLNTIAGFPKAAEETGQNSDFVAGLELAASYARVALEKVEASNA